MGKIKKVVITASAIVLLTSGLSYTLCKNRDKQFDRYLKKYQSDEKDDFMICAHRGYSSIEVENTYQAISYAAGERYVDCIEVDARMTNDGRIVLSHDNILLNRDLIPIKVSDLTLDEATSMDFIYKIDALPNFFWYGDEQIMINSRNQELNNQIYHLISLSEGIKICGDKTIIIDLKFNNDIEKFTEELKKEIINSDGVIFQSFNVEGVTYLQEHSDFDCMLLVDSKSDFKYIKNFKRVAIEKSLVTYDLIKEFVTSGIKVAVWTVNNTSDLEPILDELQEYYKKITYITNYPDLILTRLNERNKVRMLGKVYI